jgi:predicted transposase/invertase (TIGR01784 family)
LQTISLEQYVAEIDKAEARMEGKEEGRVEGKFEVARNFLKMGLPLDQISPGTGLTVEEISGLR